MEHNLMIDQSYWASIIDIIIILLYTNTVHKSKVYSHRVV